MSAGGTNVSCDKYRKLIGTLDTRLRKIVLANYQGSESSHINFAKFFVLNSSVLGSMRLEVQVGHVGDGAWISTQRRLLQIKRRASRGAQFDFVSGTGSFSLLTAEQVHDLSILRPLSEVSLALITPPRDILFLCGNILRALVTLQSISIISWNIVICHPIWCHISF
jgi:hypothetical protein